MKKDRGSMERDRNSRRGLAFGFTAVAAVLVSASVAFACVQTRGQIRVTGVLGTQSTAWGNGFHPGHGNVEYCGAPKPGAKVPAPTGFGAAQRPDVILAVSPSAKCNPLGAGSFQPGGPNTLADGNYEVMYCNGTVFQLNANGKVKDISSNSGHGSCYFYDGVGDDGILIGQLSVGAGSGSGVFKIPGGATVNGPDNWAGVAIRRCGTAPTVSGCASSTPQGTPGPPHVNMAPLSII